MKILPLDRNSTINVKTTGYTAAGSLLLSVGSGVLKNKSARKIHKPFAYLTAFFTLVHIGLVEYNNHQYKKLQNR